MNYRFRLLIRLRPVLRFVKFRVLHVDDSPQRMARGVAVGFFVAYIPILGLHMLLALLLAQLIRANKVISVMVVWICNPLTFVLIYYPCYRLGHFLLPFFNDKPQVELDQIQTLIDQVFSVKYTLIHLFTADYWRQVWAVFMEVGLETLIGGIILGTIIAKISYWFSYYFIIGYRTRKQARKSAWK
jgi:uncharacterized protein (DUF2062 family)